MRNNNTKITLALFSAIITVVITIPVLYGYITCPLGQKFLGITGLYPVEQFYYLSIGPSQAVKGHVLFADKYGRLPDEDVLINPIANVIGLISSITHFSLPVSFNVFRVFSSLFLVFSFYYLSQQFIKSRFTLLISLFIYCFSGGFDFLFEMFHLPIIDSIDDSCSEANIFISMSGEYYLPLANALFVLALAFAYNFFYKQKNQLFLCGLALLALGFVYIYGLVPAIVIITVSALYKGYRKKNLKATILSLLQLSVFCLPVVVYYLWLLVFKFPAIAEDGWRSFPSWLSFASTFGFGFMFTLIGLLIKTRKEIIDEGYLLIWVVTTVCLIYIPQTVLPIQLQMLIGLSAPLSIMFGTTLEKISSYISSKISFKGERLAVTMTSSIIFCIVLLSSTTNLKFYKDQFATMQKHEIPSYINLKINDAMKWSAGNMREKDLVIISRKLGFIFSSITACKVYMGTAPLRQETPERKATKVALNLTRGNKLKEAKEAFQKTGADYLFLDKLLAETDFEQLREILKGCYRERYVNAEVSILQLK